MLSLYSFKFLCLQTQEGCTSAVPVLKFINIIPAFISIGSLNAVVKHLSFSVHSAVIELKEKTI